MLVIPFTLPPGSKRGPLVVVLILEKENLDRMRVADPFDIHFSQYALPYFDIANPIRELDVVIAYEEDTKTLMEFQKSGDIAGLMRWLERGRQIQVGDLLQPTPLRKT